MQKKNEPILQPKSGVQGSLFGGVPPKKQRANEWVVFVEATRSHPTILMGNSLEKWVVDIKSPAPQKNNKTHRGHIMEFDVHQSFFKAPCPFGLSTCGGGETETAACFFGSQKTNLNQPKAGTRSTWLCLTSDNFFGVRVPKRLQKSKASEHRLLWSISAFWPGSPFKGSKSRVASSWPRSRGGSRGFSPLL